MKKLLSIVAICFLATTAFSQGKLKKGKAAARSASSTAVEVAQVPQPVQDSHNQNFAGSTVHRWEVKQNSGKKQLQWYTAVFTTTESMKAQARYKPEGNLVSSSTYYDAAKAPDAIKSAATSRYSGYTLVGCEKINVPSKSKNFYRVRLKKGSTKITTYLDDTGAEVTKEQAPTEALEAEEGEK